MVIPFSSFYKLIKIILCLAQTATKNEKTTKKRGTRQSIIHSLKKKKSNLLIERKKEEERIRLEKEKERQAKLEEESTQFN